MNIDILITHALCLLLKGVVEVDPQPEDSSADIPLPSLVIACECGDEHDILRGVYEVECSVTYTTAPEDTTMEDHRSSVYKLHSKLSDYGYTLAALDAMPDIKIFNVRNLQAKPPEQDDQQRVTKLTFTTIAASTN